MDFQAILNGIMNTSATGTPSVPPVIPPTASNQNSSISNSEDTSTRNPKKDKEQERRAATNQRFEELLSLIKHDGDGKMSQAKILKAAVTACIRHKREFFSDPRSRGLIAGLERIKQLTIQLLKHLNLPSDVKNAYIQNIEKVFEDFLDVVLPIFIPTAAPAIPPVPSTSDASTSDTAEEARKKRKRRYEQNRRDNQGDGFGLLRQFIRENNLFKAGDEKIQVLETIICYLQVKPQLYQTAATHVGFFQGRKLGLNLALAFFKSEDHLLGYHAVLQSYIDAQSPPLNSSIHMGNLRFDKNAIMHFMSLHPTIVLATVLKSVQRIPFSLWRPWE